MSELRAWERDIKDKPLIWIILPVGGSYIWTNYAMGVILGSVFLVRTFRTPKLPSYFIFDITWIQPNEVFYKYLCMLISVFIK